MYNTQSCHMTLIEKEVGNSLIISISVVIFN